MKTKVLSILFMVFFTITLHAATVTEQPVSGTSQTITAIDQAPTAADPKVLVSENVAPPEWLEKAIDSAASVPVVGKYVVVIAKYLGVVASILTLLVTFLLGICRVLLPLASFANLTKLANFLVLVQNSKIMYYLKFFSVYNAKKQPKEENGEADKTA